jgi:hypothetical protein
MAHGGIDQGLLWHRHLPSQQEEAALPSTPVLDEPAQLSDAAGAMQPTDGCSIGMEVEQPWRAHGPFQGLEIGGVPGAVTEDGHREDSEICPTRALLAGAGETRARVRGKCLGPCAIAPHAGGRRSHYQRLRRPVSGYTAL